MSTPSRVHGGMNGLISAIAGSLPACSSQFLRHLAPPDWHSVWSRDAIKHGESDCKARVSGGKENMASQLISGEMGPESRAASGPPAGPSDNNVLPPERRSRGEWRRLAPAITCRFLDSLPTDSIFFCLFLFNQGEKCGIACFGFYLGRTLAMV